MRPIHSEYEDDRDMIEIVREFADEATERADGLESCLGSGSLSQLQDLAHQLKGAGGGYGYPQITDAAAALESALKQGAGDGVITERLGSLCEVLRAIAVPE